MIEIEKGVYKYNAGDVTKASWVTLYKINEMSDEQLHKYGIAKLKKAVAQVGEENE